jgi:hypothetical protein
MDASLPSLRTAQEAWQAVLGQLQMEMPRASFDTWVRDTEALSLDDGTLTISTRNEYARDWLESRLQSTVRRLLVGISNQAVEVCFVVRASDEEESDDVVDEDEPEVGVEPVQWLDYDKIVQPHKQIVVKGYLRRLGLEIGPKAIWLYIGFHQAAWKANRSGSQPLYSGDVVRFSGLSSSAFWRLMQQEKIREQLSGLVQRIDPIKERRYHRGRDGRPHRSPVRYQVCMTPRLTCADADAVCRMLSQWMFDFSLSEALQILIETDDITTLLSAGSAVPGVFQYNTVMDIVRGFAGDEHTPELDQMAQQLHRRIINSLGDIHIPHYFIKQTIHRYNLTPAQAWLITVARDMAYINAHTGERREVVTFKNGYQEMAELVGSSRYKTIQSWLNPQWQTQSRGGNVCRFLQEQPIQDARSYEDLRTETMLRSFHVLLDEPLDADGSNKVDANGGNRLDANGSNSQTRMGVLVDADGGNMVDANGSALNTIKHPLNTHQKNTSTTQHEPSPAGAVPEFWELETLLQQNDVHPKVQRELLDVQASVHAFVSWVLYAASPQSGKLLDPLGYAISRLREHALKEARGVFRKFADLPPAELLELIDSTPKQSYELPKQTNHPLGSAWKQAMGFSNPRLTAVREILFGESE